MKEQGMFFNDEQKALLEEISKLEGDIKHKFSQDGMPERAFVDDRKSLTVTKRMEIVDEIASRYSKLKKKDALFQSQLFCAMEEYLKYCVETGYKFKGL